MRLGVLKELRPKLVATFTDKPGTCEGLSSLRTPNLILYSPTSKIM